MMQIDALPDKAQIALLQDAVERDRTTARRSLLLRTLWRERYLTRSGLIARVEGELGRGCFGKAAWEDTFYRDMSAVKAALKEAGFELAYSRGHLHRGYYLRGQPRLHPHVARILDGCVAEVDPAQIAIYRQLPPADRFRQGCAISDTARQAVAYRIQQRQPELSLADSYRLAGQRVGK
jgi:hypothetical protein